MAWSWTARIFIVSSVYFTVVFLLIGFPSRRVLQWPDRRTPRGQYAISYGQDKYWRGWDHIEYLFIFGDSWTVLAFEPTGEHATSGHLIMESAHWNPNNWHITGGSVWPEFLTAQHNQSVVQLANLARGGATIDLDLIHPFSSILPGMIDLGDEVETSFQPYADSPDSFPWTPENSLFIIWMGINDIHNADAETSQWFPTEFEEYADDVDRLYQKGARNFLLMNIPPLERAPLALREGKVEEWQAWVQDWNHNILAIADNLSCAYPDVTAFHLDTYQLFSDVMADACAHPETCEIQDTTGFCPFYAFGTPDFDTKFPECELRVDEYLWLNDVHPTTRMYNLTARAIADALMTEA